MSSDAKKILGFILVALVIALLLSTAMVMCNYGNRVKIHNQQEEKGTAPKGD